jgi:branched-subunit amino acid transport protein AzlD
MSNEYLALFVLTMSLATMLTRTAPFLLPGKFLDCSLIRSANQILPMAILTLLIIYSIKDSRFGQWPFAAPEGISIAILTVVHIKFRNALLSIASGTLVYMLFKQVIFEP